MDQIILGDCPWNILSQEMALGQNFPGIQPQVNFPKNIAIGQMHPGTWS
jgi:hypothetical protein